MKQSLLIFKGSWKGGISVGLSPGKSYTTTVTYM